jgi:hypothetical protein
METLENFPIELRGAKLRYPWPEVAATGQACRLERGVDFPESSTWDAVRVSASAWGGRHGYRYESRRESGGRFVWVKFTAR